MKFQRLEELAVAGKRVFVRVDFNVPLDAGGRITDDTRIRAALPTIQALLQAGGRVILASHLGRPKGQVVESLRLTPVAERLSDLLDQEVRAAPDCVGPEVEALVQVLHGGEALLLENVRFHPGETKGDAAFSKELARISDLFVNDAFGTAHRAHCSTTGVAKLLPPDCRAAGKLMEKELATLGQILSDPPRPFVAILGGAKVSDKITVVDHLLDRVSGLVIGGGMTYTFLKALGHRVGLSKLEEDQLDVAQAAIEKAQTLGVDLLLPVDHVVADEFSATATATLVDGVDIPDDRMALDVGPKTIEKFSAYLKTAGSVVWNGPLGVFEWDAFAAGTKAIAEVVAAADAVTVVGGGDSLAVIKKYGLEGRFNHVSTGGGAFLQMLEGKVLPGVAALLQD